MTRTLVDPYEAAKILGVSRSFLAKQRMKKAGPPFVRLSPGAIRYRIADLEAWLEQNRIAPGASTEKTRAGSDQISLPRK